MYMSPQINSIHSQFVKMIQVASREGWHSNLSWLAGADYETIENFTTFQFRNMMHPDLWPLFERFKKGRPGWNISLQNIRRNKRGTLEFKFESDEDWLNGNEPEVVKEMRFADLLFFTNAENKESPDVKTVLVIPPYSGHYSTLLRNTVKDINIASIDVYLPEWKNMRDVDVVESRFGIAEYVEHIIESVYIMKDKGLKNINLFGVCQPCPLIVAALSLIAEYDPETLKIFDKVVFAAGPIDVSKNPTVINKLATETNIETIRNAFMKNVTDRYIGGGRGVHMGMIQQFSFMFQNMEKHKKRFKEMKTILDKYEDKIATEEELHKLFKDFDFYFEYFASLDLPEEFDLETVENIFQKNSIANGDIELLFSNENNAVAKRLGIKTGVIYKINPNKISDVNFISVEGSRDDITGLGQTSAIKDICPNSNHESHIFDVGHYGVFSGSVFKNDILNIVIS